MAAVICVGDDELRSGVLGRGSRGRGREQRVRERSEGPRGVSVASLEGLGRKPEVARAASALATHLVVLLAEEEDDKGALVGWAASWAASKQQ